MHSSIVSVIPQATASVGYVPAAAAVPMRARMVAERSIARSGGTRDVMCATVVARLRDAFNTFPAKGTEVTWNSKINVLLLTLFII